MRATSVGSSVSIMTPSIAIQNSKLGRIEWQRYVRSPCKNKCFMTVGCCVGLPRREGACAALVSSPNQACRCKHVCKIATAVEHRRSGHARTLVSSLLAYGVERGATDTYLQLELSNHTARTLYESDGFTDCYEYHLLLFVEFRAC